MKLEVILDFHLHAEISCEAVSSSRDPVQSVEHIDEMVVKTGSDPN